jgi:hypothetical protein
VYEDKAAAAKIEAAEALSAYKIKKVTYFKFVFNLPLATTHS